MSPTRVEVRTVERGSGPAIEVGTAWEPLRNGPVTADRMTSFLEKALRDSSANDRVSKRAHSMLHRLLAAEMAVHNVNDPAMLHLHETGTPDTLVDMVGISLLMDLMELDGDWIRATPVSLGSGTVATDHGVFDVPVPAVRHLLRGVPSVRGPVEGELATPTGMAVVLSIVEEWVGPVPPGGNGGTVIGRGAGARTYPDHPNVLSILEGP